MREPELVFGHDAEVAQFVAERIQRIREPNFEHWSAIGVAKNGKLIAGVVYHEYKPQASNLELTVAASSPFWATRGVIAGLLHYPFRQLGVWLVYTLTPPEGEAALKVNRHIGIKQKTIIPHAFGRRRHAVLSQMTESEYKRKYEA